MHTNAVQTQTWFVWPFPVVVEFHEGVVTGGESDGCCDAQATPEGVLDNDTQHYAYRHVGSSAREEGMKTAALRSSSMDEYWPVLQRSTAGAGE